MNIFKDWNRKPTNTEMLVSKLIDNGIDLDTPLEHRNIYRVQPKVTGCESRRSLCYLGIRGGCVDINGHIDNRSYNGIDLLDSVADLASFDIEVKLTSGETFLWVYVKEPSVVR